MAPAPELGRPREYLAFALSSLVFLLTGLEVHTDSLPADIAARLDEPDDRAPRIRPAPVCHGP